MFSLCFTFLLSVQFSRSNVSNSLGPHESQHARPPCPSPTPGVHSDSRPGSQWCVASTGTAKFLRSGLFGFRRFELYWRASFWVLELVSPLCVVMHQDSCFLYPQSPEPLEAVSLQFPVCLGIFAVVPPAFSASSPSGVPVTRFRLPGPLPSACFIPCVFCCFA